MLLAIVLVVLGIAFFVGGIIFILKGVRNDSDDEISAVVPISDIKEIKNMNPNEGWAADEHQAIEQQQKDLLQAQPITLAKAPATARISEGLPLPKDPVATEEKSEEVPAKASTIETDVIKNELEALKLSSRKQIEELKNEKQKLNEALNRELSSRDEKTLSEQEREQLVWKENKLKEAQQALERLTKENQQFSAQYAEQKTKNEQLLQEMAMVRDALEVEKQSLLEKLELHKTEKEEFVAVISTLTQELKELKNKDEQIINESLEKLNIENQDLKAEKQKYLEMIKGLQDDLELIKIKNEQRVQENESAIAQLKVKNTDLEKQIQSRNSEQLDRLQQELALFQKQSQQLKSDNEHLQNTFQQAKEYNERLLEKESILHYELTKSRAQVLGLEKICMDFKIQLEEMQNIRV